MLSNYGIIGFIPSKDAGRARLFYETVLGLRVISEDGFAVVVESKGTRIRIVKLREFTPAPFTILGWEVSNIEEVVKELAGRGVAFQRYPGIKQDEIGIWTTPDSSRVAWFQDPDGNVLSLSQRPA